MAIDKLQASRFELKYMINEEVALRIRDFVRGYLDLDEYSVGKPNYSYPVHSLYLDSDDLRLYWATIGGDKNRYKLRIRFYSDNPQVPVFFEIKQRMNNCILKQRSGVRREAVADILAGYVPKAGALFSENPKHQFALLRFCELMEGIQARPKAHVAYYREAYVPENDNSVRLTLDRQVRIEPELTPRLSSRMPNPVAIWGKNDVILELKFTGRFPGWFGELVRAFELKQRGAAKYVDGVALVGEYWFTRRAAAAAGNGDEIFLPNSAGRVLMHEES